MVLQQEISMKKTILAFLIICSVSTSHVQALPSLSTVTQELGAVVPQVALLLSSGFIARECLKKMAFHWILAVVDLAAGTTGHKNVARCVTKSIEIIRKNRMKTGIGRTDISLEDSDHTREEYLALPEEDKAAIRKIMAQCEDEHHGAKCTLWTLALMATVATTPILSYTMYQYS